MFLCSFTIFVILMSTLLDFISFSLLSQVNGGCEQYRFISGLDEMALPCEIGLYFDFNVTADGIPFGCPGLELFNATYFEFSILEACISRPNHPSKVLVYLFFVTDAKIRLDSSKQK